MLVVTVGIEASGCISPDCLSGRRTTDGAGKSRISLSSEGSRLESSGNAISPLLGRPRVRRYLFTNTACEGERFPELRLANLESGIVMS
jgi:hypothetical protein